jgi:hypothetical protein
MLFLLSLMFSLQQNQRRRGRNRFSWKRGLGGRWEVGGEVARTMYTHVSKCKNNKIKGERDRERERKSV